jgi:ABC-type transporter Mla MlaB component
MFGRVAGRRTPQTTQLNAEVEIMTFVYAASLAIEAPTPRTYVIRVSGDLDRLLATRLLRLVDARLQLVAQGQCATAHIVVDLIDVHDLCATAVPALHHAHHAAGGRGVSLELVGAKALAERLGAQERQALSMYRSYPSVEAALQSHSPN